MQTIEAGFNLFEWQYETIPERNALRSAFTGRATNYQVFVMRIEGEGLYRFVILCPLEASAEHLGGLSEFLHRTNTSLPLGAFELDFDRGAVRWVSSADTNGDPLPAHWIGGSVQRGLTSFETIWPELLAVAEGRLAAADGAMRCQIAMELPNLNHELQNSDVQLKLSSIEDEASELYVEVTGDDTERARQMLESLFGHPLPFALRSA
jgi:hypothetical protein